MEQRIPNPIRYHVTSGACASGADGSAAHPFASLEAARDAVRRTVRTADLTGIDILVSGSFARSETLSLTDPEDSGSEQCPVRWTSKDGAVLSGGIRIPRAAFSPLDPSDPFYACFKENARQRIVSTDLKRFGFSPSDTAFSDDTPFPQNCEPLLYAGTDRMRPARYPKEGFLYMEDVETGDDFTFRFRLPEKEAEEIRGWTKDPTHLYAGGYYRFYWAGSRSRVLSFDPGSRRMELSCNGYYARNGMPVYWYHIPEELTETGEYYLSEDAVLYCILPEGAEEVTVPRISVPLLDVKADHVSFEGLTFCDTRDTMARLHGEHLTVADCRFLRSGKDALTFEGDHNRLADSEIAQCAMGGTHVTGGDEDTLRSADTVVENNYFHDFSLSGLTYRCAIRLNGCGITIAHNEFAASNHEAIEWLGHNHCIEYNEFHDLCNFTDDAGCCYSGRSLDRYGNVLRYNYFHDIGSRQLAESGVEGLECGTRGIYFDDGLGGQTAYGNIFENIPFGPAYAIGGGPDNIVDRNLMINCETGIYYDDRYYGQCRYDKKCRHAPLEPIYEKYQKNPVLAQAYPTILQMKPGLDTDDPWNWSIPARSSVCGNYAYTTEANKDKQYLFDLPVTQYSRLENNTLIVYKDGAQPSVREALRESGLDIPLEKIGRNKTAD